MDAGEEYIHKIWMKDGMKICKWCEKKIFYDSSSGLWIHAGFKEVDDRNGLYCNPEMWNNLEIRKYCEPKQEIVRENNA